MTAKIHNRIATTVIAAVLLAVSGLFGIQQAFAAVNSLYITPASASVQNGSNVTVSVRYTPPADGADTVDVDLNYDSSKLTYVGTSFAGSPYLMQIPSVPDVTSGKVSFTSTVLSTTIMPDSLVANITFTAKVGSGATTMNLAGSNTALAGNPLAPALSAATLTLTSPVVAPTCPTGQTGTYPNCKAPSSGGVSTPAPVVTPKPTSTPATGSTTHTSAGTADITAKPTAQADGPTPAVVTNTNSKYTLATVVFTTKTPTQAYIRFGTGDQLLSTTPVSDYSTMHSLQLPSSILLPGLKYHYVVVTTDKQGVVSTTSMQDITTKGLKITITAVDKMGKPLKGVEITLHSNPQSAKTDAKGNATFDNVAVGNHSLVYTQGGKTYDQPIIVTNNVDVNTQTSDAQHFSVAYAVVAASTNVRLIAWISIAVLIVILIAFMAKSGRLGMAVRLRNGGSSDLPMITQPIVVGGSASRISTDAQTGYDDNKVSTVNMNSDLHTIPDPSNPSPGSTVTPVGMTDVSDNKSGTEE